MRYHPRFVRDGHQKKGYQAGVGVEIGLCLCIGGHLDLEMGETTRFRLGDDIILLKKGGQESAKKSGSIDLR